MVAYRGGYSRSKTEKYIRELPNKDLKKYNKRNAYAYAVAIAKDELKGRRMVKNIRRRTRPVRQNLWSAFGRGF